MSKTSHITRATIFLFIGERDSTATSVEYMRKVQFEEDTAR